MSTNKRRTVRAGTTAEGEKLVRDDTGRPAADGCAGEDEGPAGSQLAPVGQGDGYPAWWPAGMRNGSPGRGLMLSRLFAGAELLRELEARMAQDVADGRALGASWQHVGLALGISAEGARSRYGRPAGRRPGGEAASS